MTNFKIDRINKVKNKLLRDVKNYPEEYLKIKDLLIKQKKLKEEFPFTFIDKDLDIKKINIFRKTPKAKFFGDKRLISPIKSILF